MAGSKQTPISIVLKTEGTQAVTSALRGVKQSYLDLERDIAAAGAAGSGKRTAEAQRELKAKLAGLHEEAKLLKEVNAAREKEIKAARAEYQFNTAVGKSRDRSVYGAFMQGEGAAGMMRAAGASGLAIGGMIAAFNLVTSSLRQFSGFLINEVMRPEMALRTRSVQISNNSGGKLTAEGVVSSAKAIGIRNNVAPEAILEAAGKFQDKTGEPGLGLEMMGTLATLSKGRGLEIGSLSEMAAALYRPGQKKEDLDKLMLALTAQGEAGSVPMRELSMLGGRLTAPAEKFGGSWFTKVATANAILQTSRRTGFGSVEAAAEGLQAFSQDSLRIGKSLSPNSIAKLGGVETIVDPIKMIGDFYRKTSGNVTTLHGMGFSEPAAKLISSYQGTYTEARTAAKAAGKSDVEAKEAGATAVEEFIRSLATANTTLQAESEKRNAVMQTDGEQLDSAMTRIKESILKGTPGVETFVKVLSEHADEIGQAAGTLATALLGLAEGVVNVINWYTKLTTVHGEGDVLRTVIDKGANTHFQTPAEKGYWRKGEGIWEYIKGAAEDGKTGLEGMPGSVATKDGATFYDPKGSNAKYDLPKAGNGELPMSPAELASLPPAAMTPGSKETQRAQASAHEDATASVNALAEAATKATHKLQEVANAADAVNRKHSFTER